MEMRIALGPRNEYRIQDFWNQPSLQTLGLYSISVMSG
jgi:hypothetical protein